MAAQQHSWGEERLDMTPMGMVRWFSSHPGQGCCSNTEHFSISPSQCPILPDAGQMCLQHDEVCKLLGTQPEAASKSAQRAETCMQCRRA